MPITLVLGTQVTLVTLQVLGSSIIPSLGHLIMWVPTQTLIPNPFFRIFMKDSRLKVRFSPKKAAV